ncbi:MAG TPA: zinc chelation protein SecC, partial [Roseiflexaceae bacterium]
YAALHLEAFTRDHPDATWADLLRARSEVLNHFVMALPVEAPDPSILDNIITQTRISLKLAGESLGIGKSEEDTQAQE